MGITIGKHGFHRVFNDGCALSIERLHARGGWFISSLSTLPEMRGRGHASRLLARMTKWGDKTGAKLFLTAAPYGGSPMTTEQTVEMYHKVGFEPDLSRGSSPWAVPMVRHPRAC